MAAKFGFKGKMFLQTDGVAGTAGWVEVENVRDLTLSVEKAQGDATTRGNNGWKAMLAGLKDGEVSFDMIRDPQDVDYQAMRGSFLNDTILGFKVLDGGTATTGEGLVADMMVTNFEIVEELEDVQKVNITLKPGYSATAPTWQIPA